MSVGSTPQTKRRKPSTYVLYLRIPGVRAIVSRLFMWGFGSIVPLVLSETYPVSPNLSRRGVYVHQNSLHKLCGHGRATICLPRATHYLFYPRDCTSTYAHVFGLSLNPGPTIPKRSSTYYLPQRVAPQAKQQAEFCSGSSSNTF